MQFVFNTTHQIVCEYQALKNIAGYCQELGIKKPLIVTDEGIIKLSLHTSITDALVASKIPVCLFTEVEADPSEQLILNATKFAINEGIDGVIGLGGGSSLDVAKLVALLVNSEQQLNDIYGVGMVKGKRLPLILIPTTAGTGSEVTPIAIVTTGKTTKAGVVAKQLLPDIAILDASLTMNLPAHVTAATGIDAMVHAIEAYTSKHKKNVISDIFAKQALRLLSANILEATHNGHNQKARQEMLLGACLAGQAFANAPVAAVHALAYPLGGHFHIPHGLSNSLVLPFVLEFNLPEAHQLYSEISEEILPPAELTQRDSKENSRRLIQYIKQLTVQLNLPCSLKAMNIEKSHISMLAEDAMLQTRLLVNNPREVTLSDAKHIYESAWQGIK